MTRGTRPSRSAPSAHGPEDPPLPLTPREAATILGHEVRHLDDAYLAAARWARETGADSKTTTTVALALARAVYLENARARR